MAVSALPQFREVPKEIKEKIFHGTIFLNCESMEELQSSYIDSVYHQQPSHRYIKSLSKCYFNSHLVLPSLFRYDLSGKL